MGHSDSPPKILIVPPLPWYVEAHAEYLVRYLSDEFFIEVADVPYPPYENFIERFPETNPFQRSPDDYDLIVPLLATHWVVTDKEKYKHKTALIWYQPNEGYYYPELAAVAGTTPLAEESLKGKPNTFSVRFGVDTNLFKPLNFKKDTTILHVGMIGNLYNPRRMVKEVIEAIKSIENVELLLFPTKVPRSPHDMDFLGGFQAMKYILAGDRPWPALPNLYNRMDVLIRCESDPGYSFPVLEAAACGIPVIATDSGIDHFITEADGGILIEGNREFYLNNPKKVIQKLREAIIWMRDNPYDRQQMGMEGLREIHKNWKWEKHLDNWRKFFNGGIKNAKQEL